jgi:hypothetical protein
MAETLTDATVVVNNDTIAVLTNSITFTEGLGEQKMRVVSLGGGATEQIYSNDLETNFSTVSFDLPSTSGPDGNIEKAKIWKANGNANVVQVAGENADGSIVRTFTGAAVTANYEVNIGVDATISIEFTSNSAT